jgi:hypothetical protein
MRLANLALAFAALLLVCCAVALAQPAQQVPSAHPSLAHPTPSPTPKVDPFTFRGYFRDFYFTRQNASNNYCCQFNFSPGAKYNSNGVNQASLNQGIQVHGDYSFIGTGLDVGAGYFYANPANGPCVVPANHLKGGICVTQVPPATNADDTLPGFTVAALDEAYLSYLKNGWYAKVGDQLINTPWANPDLSRLKADAFQGADATYSFKSGLNFDVMDMIAFQPRGASTFSQQTLLTSYPAGGGGLPANINYPGGQGVTTPGFWMYKAGYITPAGTTNPWQVDGYLYNVTDIVNMYWGDAKYMLGNLPFKPYVELQGGWESNTGTSVVGKIQSSLAGIRLGANVTKNVLFTAAFDNVPWHTDQVYLPKNVTCNNSNYQVTATGATLAYFLPIQAAQCFTNPHTDLTSIYYGGWASPYTDNWATDPIFTTQMIQGMADRRSPGTSYKIAAVFTSNNHRLIFLASDAWYNYGNALAGQNTNEWDLDGTYRFSKAPPPGGAYRGLVLRQRIGVRTYTNTYYPNDTPFLGGVALFKYSRSQLEYDF